MTDVELCQIAVVIVISDATEERLQRILRSVAPSLRITCASIELIEVICGKTLLTAVDGSIVVLLNGMPKQRIDMVKTETLIVC